MKAIYIREFGGPENLEIREVPDPQEPQGSEVLVRVKAGGLNRADLLQRRGMYPPPAGYSPNIPGLEFAGEVMVVGDDVADLKAGDRVFGITAGEAQAELVSIHHGLLTKIPSNLNYLEAGAIPEAFITANDAVFTQGNLKGEDVLLVHAVGSGVGLAALQIGKAYGHRVIGTSRTQGKLDRCRGFGLDDAIAVTSTADFAERVLELTNSHGADVIIDLVGAAYFEQNLRSAASRGRLLLVGLTSGSATQFNLGVALSKRLRLIGTVLRGRSIMEKAEATGAFRISVLPLLESGAVRAVVDRVFSYREVRAAHEYLESNESFGKVVLDFAS